MSSVPALHVSAVPENTLRRGVRRPLCDSSHSKKSAVSLTTKPKKSVTFKPSVACKRTLHVNNYTDEELFQCWWTDDESQAIRKNANQACKLFVQGLIEKESKKHSLRGLEYKCCKVTQKAKIALRHAAYDAVLIEQDFQMDSGFEADWEAMAETYKVLSAKAHDIAHRQALKDHADATR